MRTEDKAQGWDAGPLADLAPGALTKVEADGQVFAAWRMGRFIVAVRDSCPHRGGPLSQGQLVDSRLECPWHGATFDLRTGGLLRGPDCPDLQLFVGRADGDRVWLSPLAPPASQDCQGDQEQRSR